MIAHTHMTENASLSTSEQREHIVVVDHNKFNHGKNIWLHLPIWQRMQAFPHQNEENICLPDKRFINEGKRKCYNHSNLFFFKPVKRWSNDITLCKRFGKHVYPPLNKVDRCTPLCSLIIKGSARMNKICHISNIWQKFIKDEPIEGLDSIS